MWRRRLGGASTDYRRTVALFNPTRWLFGYPFEHLVVLCFRILHDGLHLDDISQSLDPRYANSWGSYLDGLMKKDVPAVARLQVSGVCGDLKPHALTSCAIAAALLTVHLTLLPHRLCQPMWIPNHIAPFYCGGDARGRGRCGPASAHAMPALSFHTEVTDRGPIALKFGSIECKTHEPLTAGFLEWWYSAKAEGNLHNGTHALAPPPKLFTQPKTWHTYMHRVRQKPA